jgi:glutaredoxin
MRRAYFVAGWLLSACHSKPDSAAKPAVSSHADESANLPEVRVEADGGPYLFSYYDKDGKLHDADSLAGVPKESRRQVLVRDLSRSPTELQVDRYLYLADVRMPEPSAGYPTSVVSRYQFEAAGSDNGSDSADDDGTDGGRSEQVIVYGTTWCGACKAARAHLTDKHIPFVEKDIEKEPAAAQELARKAKKSGLKLGGVPVIDVRGQLMMGYDPGSIDRAWASRDR